MYYHPDYNQEGVKRGDNFRLEFNYYSLSLVLLEIGLCDTVSNVKAKSSRELQKKLLATRVPILGHSMGTQYRDTVDFCLRSRFKEKSANITMATILEFQQFVVGALMSLRPPKAATHSENPVRLLL